MTIIEQTLVPKSPKRKAEDGIVITDNFIAVIDGSTSKSARQLSLFRTNGRYCMQLVSDYIRRMPKTATCQQFCTGVSAYVRRHYSRRSLPSLAAHPEDRICASAAVFSRVSRQVWLVGDCQCLIGGELYENPKPYEQALAEERAARVRQLLAQGVQPADLLTDDTARAAIIPHMLEAMQRQNVDYAVIDGFPIPMHCVRVITLDFQPWEIVLATDGYPWLCPTLAESEQRLDHQRRHDPLNIGDFKATKGFTPGNHSFDDRAYIRFRV